MKLRLLLWILPFALLGSCARQPAPKPVVTYPNYHKQNLGASAKDLLSNAVFTSLTVEVQYVPGFKPDPATIDTLAAFLSIYLQKCEGIKIVTKELHIKIPKTLAKDDVAVIEDSARSIYPADQDLTMYLLFTGSSHPDKNILGMAYRGTSAVIFGKSIAANAGPNKALTRAELETSVLLHEVGHLLGLGNPNGAAANSRTGKDKKGHCNNKMCLMYSSTETRNLSVIKRRGKLPHLDKECLKFLEEIRCQAELEEPAGRAERLQVKLN